MKLPYNAKPKSIVVDDAGNIWVGAKGVGSIIEINNVTKKIMHKFNVSQFDKPKVIAIDEYGNIWVPNIPGASLVEIFSIAKGPEYFPYRYSLSTPKYSQWP